LINGGGKFPKEAFWTSSKLMFQAYCRTWYARKS